MASYKVSYFTFKGLGEPVRFMLAYANVDFTDNRVEWDDWPALKPNTPLGQMPVLEAEGRTFHHSGPICRYLGNKFNLNGANALENYEIDCVAETVNELRGKVATWYYAYKQAKNEKYEKLKSETLPFYLQKLEAQASKNGGFLAIEGKVTWGDVYSVGVLDYVSSLIGFNVLEGYENLMKVRSRIFEAEGVQKYIKSRPEDRIPNFFS